MPQLPQKPQPTQTTTDALWRRWRDHGDVEARRELLGRYLGLVHHAAREVAPRVRDAVSLDELVSAGSLGLMQAMAGFDIDRGLAFSTFAMRRIRGAILDELRARDPLSRADRAHVRRLDSAVAELEQRSGRAPTPREVAHHLGVDSDTLHRWRERTAHAGVVSLESEPNGRVLADQLGDDGTDAVHGAVERAERRGAIRAALANLPSRERLVVSRSYFEEKPLREIAAELGVTESRVCQLRAQALARLRRVQTLEFAHE
ncbi:MAG: sigma-70 family RNA polymerase sigma factor [Gemmatimonadales bacterium]